MDSSAAASLPRRLRFPNRREQRERRSGSVFQSLPSSSSSLLTPSLSLRDSRRPVVAQHGRRARLRTRRAAGGAVLGHVDQLAQLRDERDHRRERASGAESVRRRVHDAEEFGA